MSKPTIHVRPAVTLDDAELVLDLITCLADFEHLTPPDAEARLRFRRDGFEVDPPRFRALLAQVGDAPPCGYAILFDTYSTFLCRPTLYLEDIFILPEMRRHGVGNEIMLYCVREALARGYGRMEWQCLDWNVNAQAFYARIGASHLEDWYFYRLDREGMARFAKPDAGLGEGRIHS
jgi:GNAT superfamily N-acetyltransferase